MTTETSMTAHEMLADAEQRAVEGYPFQQIDLGRTDRKGWPVRSYGVGVNAQSHGEFTYRHWFADEFGHEAYDIDREEALRIIIEVQMHRPAKVAS